MSVTVENHRSAIEFVLPPDREAAGPPEARGLERDEVRLLVAGAGTAIEHSSGAGVGAIQHSVFRELPRFLRPGDLVVVNDSATMSAAVDGRLDGDPVVVHLSTWLDDGRWVVEVRSTEGKPGPWASLHAGSTVDLPGGVAARLDEPWLPPAERLWTAEIAGASDVRAWLDRYGRPVTYAYVRERWPARYYRTVFGRRLGSAEMPSASRPFTDRLVTDLVVAGVALAPITLHTGVSSPEQGEPPSPERFDVPASTARLVASTRAAGGRVIAIGTTVTRALETVADETGDVEPRSGWTELVLGPHRPARVVDGIVTGWHAPGASHLMLLEAVAGEEPVRAAYRAALAGGYLWHEFGDSALLLR